MKKLLGGKQIKPKATNEQIFAKAMGLMVADKPYTKTIDATATRVSER